MEKYANLLKYIDMCGIPSTFYREKMPKFYTIQGGIFSIITLIVSFLVLLIFSLNDLKRKYPSIITTSIPTAGYKNIKFGKEKIWIPWSIVDYNNNEYVNHTGLLFPIIYYYSGVKNDITKEFNLTTKILNYKLCNETSMANEDNNYEIEISLDQIYCIDMEELDMGGSWTSSFINYIQFDLYYCQDGVKYNESDPKCTSFKKIRDFIGEDNSLDINFYYPIVQFQPENVAKPITIIYQQIFYHLSKYVNKIERLFLHEHILTDDFGWILKKEINNSYWGLNSITGETYFNGEENDIFNEGSNSRAYSFNLYLEPGIIHHKRNYKKLYTIFSDNYPMSYIIFLIMKIISTFFKRVENNKKMIELLFMNFKENPNEFEENLKKLKTKNSFNKNINENKSNGKKMNTDIYINNKKNILSSRITNKNINNLNLSNKNLVTNTHKGKSFEINSTKNYFILNENSNKNNKNIGLNLKMNSTNKTININTTNNKKKIFPYKYYLFSIFIKDANKSKGNIFFSKFSKIYLFLCQLFDITSYFLLNREFNSLKALYNENNFNINLFETNRKENKYNKIDINEINDCF
jgi:hypothetical protein